MSKDKPLVRRMVEEWSRRTPEAALIPEGEGVLDTPEKIQQFEERMAEVMKKYPRPGLLPSPNRKPKRTTLCLPATYT